MGQSPKPHVVDEPCTLARLLSSRLPLSVEDLGEETPVLTQDVVVTDVNHQASVEGQGVEVEDRAAT